MPTAFENYVNNEIPNRPAVAQAAGLTANNYLRATGVSKNLEERTPVQALEDLAKVIRSLSQKTTPLLAADAFVVYDTNDVGARFINAGLLVSGIVAAEASDHAMAGMAMALGT